MAAEKADLDHITTRSYSDQSSRNDADDDFAVPEKQNYARKSRTRSRITSCIAVVTIFVFGMAFQSTLAKTYTNLAYDTDFAPAREAIRMEKVEFIGALKFGEQGTVSFTNESRYFGATNTLAMETAWDDMLLSKSQSGETSDKTAVRWLRALPVHQLIRKRSTLPYHG